MSIPNTSYTQRVTHSFKLAISDTLKGAYIGSTVGAIAKTVFLLDELFDTYQFLKRIETKAIEEEEAGIYGGLNCNPEVTNIPFSLSSNWCTFKMCLEIPELLTKDIHTLIKHNNYPFNSDIVHPAGILMGTTVGALYGAGRVIRTIANF